ncbi:Cytochrome C oxidase, cbb3-type, subunit III [Nitrosospira briensis]|uniref:Cytochrome C oxidase, cbb3-type, subunit III n=1 Tax=Nitrosospira briensis TaxID=35799 RepID=A0A1I5ABE4_9PROT|nr:cytochrome c [Nitrosospira briensis]SFN59901.1 Cytochrome C oxidase, cbb3-type, subunit III [Nitrosospira briensis]
MSIRFFVLTGMAAVLIAGCGESKPPATSSETPEAVETPAPPSTSPTPPPAGPDISAAEQPASTPKVEEPRNLAARKLAPEKIKRGEDVYRANCASCHGPNGEATPGWRTPGPDGRYPPPPLDGSAHAWHHSTETLEQMIREGSPGGGMPAWDGKLTNQQIDDVIVWIKSLWPDEVYDIWYKEIENKPLPKQQG